MIKNLILDCDGTILKFVAGTLRGPRSLSEATIGDDVSHFLRSNTSKFQAFLITNQPDVSRGHADLHELGTIYRKLMRDFPIIRDFRVCPHDNQDHCLCRKPKPGMIEDLMTFHRFSKDESMVIGDTWVDILAAKNAGIRSVLINKPHSWMSNSQGHPPADLQPDFKVLSFADLKNSFFL